MKSDKKDNEKPQDDRHLVDINNSDTELNIDESFQVFWEKNKGSIVQWIVIILVVSVGFQLFKLYENKQNVNLQDEFLVSLETEDLRLAFANNHKAEPLAGLNFLKSANEVYAKAEYKEASVLYKKSTDALVGTALHAKVWMSYAISLIKSGDKTAGIKELEMLSSTETAFDAVKADALLKLIILAVDEKNVSAVDDYIARLSMIENTAYTLQRAEKMKEDYL